MGKARRRLKAPVVIGEIFGRGLKGKRTVHLVTLYQIQKAWPVIVGADLAARTLPKEIRGTTLMIAVENPVWSHHLSMMKEQLLDVLKKRHDSKLTDLRFVTETVLKKNVGDGGTGLPEEIEPIGDFLPAPGVTDPELAEVLGRMKARLDQVRQSYLDKKRK